MALFEGFDGAYGTHGEMKRNAEKHDKMEIKATARTIRAPVTPKLWADHLGGVHPIGIIAIRRDNLCMFGCIDIDEYDMDLGEIATKLVEYKLPLVPCRTKSGGLHLYLFMAEPVEAELVQVKLRELAAGLGFGGSEIFPKQKTVLWESQDLGVWLNMPYFNGDKTERYCVAPNGRGLSLRQFLAKAEGLRQTEDEMISLRVADKEDKEFKDAPPCLQHLAATKFPEGQRNKGLFGLGVFLRRKHPDKWDEMIQDMNQRFISPPLPAAEILQIIKSLRTKDYKYSCKDSPLANHCNAGLCRTRKYGVGGEGSMPTIENLTKLNSDQPVWFLDVGGIRVEMTTDDLQNPLRFQKRCMEVVGIVVPIPKRETWSGILQSLFDNKTVIEVPEEVNLEGQFMEHLETFCTDRQRAQTKEEILLGKAWHDDETDRIFFRIRDVQEYLERVKFTGMTRTQMSQKIRNNGGETFFFNLRGRGVNVFYVPANIFHVQTESHSLPTPKEDVL